LGLILSFPKVSVFALPVLTGGGFLPLIYQRAKLLFFDQANGLSPLRGIVERWQTI
jgi:hypothetical protein